MGDLVYLGSSAADFGRQVTCALAENDPVRRARRKEIASQENWTERAQAISAVFGELQETMFRS
jgi:hypothetical protein